MKRILKRKERPASQKIGLTQKRRYFKRIKNSKKRNNQIESPHNTSQYLIENNSSPFYEDEEDTDIDFIPSSLIKLEHSEELFDEDSLYQRKISSASTLGESFGIDLHIGKQTSIFSLE